MANKIVKLFCITEDNHNKFYTMEELGDGTFKAIWGRVGAAKEQSTTYPMSDWNKIYNSKLKKGYEDQTTLYKVEQIKDDMATIIDKNVADVIIRLKKFAKQMVDTNYTISSSNVTTLMIKNAQNIIDELVKLNPTLNKTDPGILDTLNKTLLNLFKILPRKMNKVQNYLVPLNTIGNETTAAVNKIIMREQDILDSLSSMVALNSTDSSTNQKIDILEQMGISMSIKDSKLEDKVNKLLGSLSDKYINSWYVKNIKTQTAYDAHLTSVDDKQEKLFWHGSRNENWINIVQKGLMIRPSGVVITGAMFGNGIYFADRALKSYGYTSGKGSRWASGNSDVAFMALYRVHVGKQLDVYEHTSECYKFDEKYLKRKGGYDSVYAHKGKSLMNNEFMVYNTNQATIYALVELRG